jgi:CheY-like chemotaxis protein
MMSGIVIIDDDALMRALLAEWLTAAGYRVNTRGSTEARIAADLLIVDVYMPRHLGAERLQSVRNEYPGVPMVAISGQFRPGVSCAGPAAQALGVQGVVAKPFCREALLEAVRSVIGPPIERVA